MHVQCDYVTCLHHHTHTHKHTHTTDTYTYAMHNMFCSSLIVLQIMSELEQRSTNPYVNSVMHIEYTMLCIYEASMFETSRHQQLLLFFLLFRSALRHFLALKSFCLSFHRPQSHPHTALQHHRR